MQCKLLPIAFCKRTAATEESTPPDKPKITLSSPILVCKSEIVRSIKESGVQDCSRLQIFLKKFSRIIFPSVVW